MLIYNLLNVSLTYSMGFSFSLNCLDQWKQRGFVYLIFQSTNSHMLVAQVSQVISYLVKKNGSL